MHISTRNKIKFFGLKNYCPICKSFVREFGPGGLARRPNSVCPVCHSMERHRLVWLFFKKKICLFERKVKMLHVAPENCFVRRLKKSSNIDYVPIDLDSPRADVKMDLTDMSFENNSFDLFYCSHVLEHIPDDRKALSEVSRVLKKKGKAVILVPIKGEKTEEDLSITDPKERLRLYGLETHVRYYGMDIVKKIKNCGFSVKCEYYANEYGDIRKKYFGLLNELILFCEKL